jgi:hypothetical protein
MDWLKASSRKGVIPVEKHLQESASPGEMGPEVLLRCGRTTATVQLASGGFDEEKFWALPEDVSQELSQAQVYLIIYYYLFLYYLQFIIISY